MSEEPEDVNEIVDQEKLVDIVETLRDKLYYDYKIRRKKDLDLVLEELQQTINRDYQIQMQSDESAVGLEDKNHWYR
ncbi:hypothetical protein [Candidatus Nanohalovita haloferacivicina]|uniref:hypothetical protein n=1 Tax=Candidatus Nanohalovita haloferacivicina TaxID=2978046 RepID=UPI00325F9510|nr:hypothetical protein HBNXNv_0353 [Candidatus Nanohalobia archaeon BNXNv]